MANPRHQERSFEASTDGRPVCCSLRLGTEHPISSPGFEPAFIQPGYIHKPFFGLTNKLRASFPLAPRSALPGLYVRNRHFA